MAQFLLGYVLINSPILSEDIIIQKALKRQHSNGDLFFAVKLLKKGNEIVSEIVRPLPQNYVAHLV